MTIVVAASPQPILQFFDDSGSFLVGGQLYTTVGGVPYPTYADAQGLIQHANPIILNSRGEIATSSGQSAQLYLIPNVNYTFALFDSQGNPIDTPTNIQGIPTQSSISNFVNAAYIGQLLWPKSSTESSAPVLSAWPAMGVDVRRFGVIGDGTTDDTLAMGIAIASGEPLDLGNLTLSVTARLTFNQNGQRVYARGGTLLWNGPSTDRLLDVTANDVQFHGVTFSGNASQVKGGLCYWSDNAARPKAIGCRFTNIVGTHVQGTTSRDSNNQYGLIISPYGVEGLEIEGCSFDNISNDNSGANATTPTTGLGFTGGIIFIQDNFLDPAVVQGIPTSGVIHGCYFTNIITVLQAGLSLANQNLFMDADGIRTYGGATVTIRLPVVISDCVFLDCAKRAIKTSTTAEVQIHHCDVIATSNLQYPMPETIKLYGDDIVLDGWNVSSFTGSPPAIIVTAHESVNLRVHNVIAGRCNELVAIIPTVTTAVIAGWRFSNIRCNNINPIQGGTIGFGISCDTLCDHFEDCIFENIDVEANGNLNKMAGVLFVANTARMEVVLRNIRVVNGDFKVAGYGFVIEDCYQEINNTSYTNSFAGRAPIELGQGAGSATTRDTVIHGLTQNIKAITSGYLAVSLPFCLIYGDRTKVSSLRVIVPSTYDTTFAHVDFDGSDFTVDDFELVSAGRANVNNYSGGTKLRMTIDGARRLGGYASADNFIACYLTTNGFLNNIVDFSPTTASSILISSGTIASGRTYAYLIDGVGSLTTNTNVVADSGLAHQANVQKF